MLSDIEALVFCDKLALVRIKHRKTGIVTAYVNNALEKQQKIAYV